MNISDSKVSMASEEIPDVSHILANQPVVLLRRCSLIHEVNKHIFFLEKLLFELVFFNNKPRLILFG